MSLGDPQSFNRYSYVGNDPVNFIDPSGLNASATSAGGYSCYIDGVLSPCSQTFSVLQSGAGVIGPASLIHWDQSANYGRGEFQFFTANAHGQTRWINIQGVSITATAFLNDPFGNVYVAGSASWTDLFRQGTTRRGFAGEFQDAIDIERGSRPPSEPKSPRNNSPCSQNEGPTLDINVSAVVGVGFQGGVQVNNLYVSPYIGVAAGAGPPLAMTVTGSNSTAAQGVNYNATASFVAALGYGGSLDVSSFRGARNSLKNGTVSGGAGTPTLSGGVYRALKLRHTCR
jgi:hypothetical protein